MKKILICVSALGVMSFTSNQLMNTYQIAEAITNVQDMKEWMMQDIESGNIKVELGEHYMHWLEETEAKLLEFTESNRLTQPSVEELELRISKYTN